MQNNCLLGIDLGSSSVKVSLLDADTGILISSARSPEVEMPIDAPRPGWAEQDPEDWWKHVRIAIRQVLEQSEAAAEKIKGIGISYQMHGLVAIDDSRKPVRPSIIWCDSRAAPVGEQAFQDLGPEYCLQNLLNSPGNFTASKLKWVQENEPEIYERIFKVMLPGDYLAMKLTGEICTTSTGLSEGILWDFPEDEIAHRVLDHFNIHEDLIPYRTNVFGIQGKVTTHAAEETGIPAGTPVAYRAGDQPNNALSLNVLEPGETAATAGTSGVIYAITQEPRYDPQSRVNTFVHVNHSGEHPRYGVLLCVNGTGIMNRWVKQLAGQHLTYEEINKLAAQINPGADGVRVFPFGNGVERIFGNRTPGASLTGIDLNRHAPGHIFRGAQEGVAFGLRYGFDILNEMGVEVDMIRAGNANMFMSPVFTEAFIHATGKPVQILDTDGALGAARGAGMGSGVYVDAPEAFAGMKVLRELEPDPDRMREYQEIYAAWKEELTRQLKHIT